MGLQRITTYEIVLIRSLHSQGVSGREIAKRTGMPYRRIYRWLSPKLLEKARASSKRDYHKRKDRCISNAKKYRENHVIELREKRRLNRQKLRIQVLSHYSKGNPRCACCGESEYKFLSIDHINNDGAEHRRKTMGGNNSRLYDWLVKNNLPEGFQVLCMNCNTAKHWYGTCPHRLEKNIITKTI